MKTINRIIMIPFILLLLVSVFENGLLTLAALIAIPLGFLQVLFCLRILFAWKSIHNKVKTFEVSYFVIVVGYFLLLNYATTGALGDDKFIQMVMYSLPVIMAISVTFLLEKLKLES